MRIFCSVVQIKFEFFCYFTYNFIQKIAKVYETESYDNETIECKMDQFEKKFSNTYEVVENRINIIDDNFKNVKYKLLYQYNEFKYIMFIYQIG